MSLYRFARTTALLSLASRYRVKIWRITFAVAFAGITAWLYADVAAFVDARHPQLAWLALTIKTLIVYAALVYCFWQFRTPVSAMPEDATEEQFERLDALQNSESKPAAPSASRLDKLVDKPELRSRRDDILQ